MHEKEIPRNYCCNAIYMTIFNYVVLQLNNFKTLNIFNLKHIMNILQPILDIIYYYIFI